MEEGKDFYTDYEIPRECEQLQELKEPPKELLKKKEYNDAYIKYTTFSSQTDCDKNTADMRSSYTREFYIKTDQDFMRFNNNEGVVYLNVDGTQLQLFRGVCCKRPEPITPHRVDTPLPVDTDEELENTTINGVEVKHWRRVSKTAEGIVKGKQDIYADISTG